ncbi:MAG: 50S ribosomal protein L24 [Oscillospiraceae bacterium]|nr:50S ribosomal protein L24 [Oscillospiraceae bacterium]
MNNLNIKKDDTVVVLAGKDKGKKGKVLAANPAKKRVIVEGVNMATVHVSAQKSGGKDSGIIKREASIDVSNVMRVCPKCGKATRLGHKFLEDGSKVSVCKKCGETI